MSLKTKLENVLNNYKIVTNKFLKNSLDSQQKMSTA